MKDYATGQLRNVVLLGHGGSGKTSLVEAMLLTSGAINRMGRVEDGSTVTDFDQEEIRRQISLSLALAPVEWKDYKINLLDTPGYTDFVGEVKSGIRVADLAVVVVDSVSGVEVGTELVWGYADERSLPRVVVVNKLNRDNANLPHVMESLRATFGDKNFVPLQLPIGNASTFSGVVDLLKMQAFVGSDAKGSPVPAELQDEAQEARVAIIEAAAESNDELIMKYLDGEELTSEEIVDGLKQSIVQGTVVPVLVAAATANTGVRSLLDTIVGLGPSPLELGPAVAEGPAGEEQIESSELAPLATLVFKTAADPFVGKMTYFRVFGGLVPSNSTVFNSRAGVEERLGQLFTMRGKEQIMVERVRAGDIAVAAKLSVTATGDTLCDKSHPVKLPGISFPSPLYSVAVMPTSKADQAKLGPTLSRICEEDPTLHWHQEPSTQQTILQGMGDTHVEIAVRRMENRFDVGVETATPRVPYQETISQTASDSYRHKKQTGGAGQFAEVHMRLEPLPAGSGYEFEWAVFGGAISRSFESSIQKGIRQVMSQGVIAGYPVVDVKASVYDGKEHPVDSKDIAFQIAGREAFKKVMMEAGPVLLEPIFKVVVTVPEEYTGDIMGDLNTKRARVQGMDQVSGKTVITALVPLAEMQRYATDLRSITQGRGLFTMELDHYENVPAHLAQQIVAAHQQEEEK